MAQEIGRAADSRDRTNSLLRRLALAGVIGPVLFWMVVVVLGAVTPEYSHVSDFVSALGAVHAPYGMVQQANFVMLGAGILALVVGVDRWNRGGWRHWLGVVLLGVFGLGVIGAGVFPADLVNPDSATNQYHDLVSLVAFFTALLGVPLISWRLSQNNGWPGYL